MNKLTDFAKGIIAGFVACALIFGLITAIYFSHKRNKETLEYAEKQQIIEELREDYGNRDPLEYLEAVPGVRGASDGAAADFIRKRDEAVQRFRSGLADR
jgi:hypothetical protein